MNLARGWPRERGQSSFAFCSGMDFQLDVQQLLDDVFASEADHRTSAVQRLATVRIQVLAAPKREES